MKLEEKKKLYINMNCKWKDFRLFEAKTYDDKKITEISNLFVQYLIGNTKGAVTRLGNIKPFINPLPSNDYTNYNKISEDLNRDIYNVLKKHLKDF